MFALLCCAAVQKKHRRANDMAEIARKRAAHFATFDSGAADTAEQGMDRIHAGGEDIRTLGPWSSAAELIEARQQALEQRAARIQEKAYGSSEDLEWTPRCDPDSPPPPHNAPSRLLDLCASALASRTSAITTLDGAPAEARSALARELSRLRRLDPPFAHLLADGAPAALSLPDCSSLDAGVVAEVLRLALTPSLRRVDLGFVGRGLTDTAAQAFLRAAGIPIADAAAWAQRTGEKEEDGGKGGEGDDRKAEDDDEGPSVAERPRVELPLEVLRLHGAYKLSNDGLRFALRSLLHLQELAIPLCSRLTDGALDAVSGTSNAPFAAERVFASWARDTSVCVPGRRRSSKATICLPDCSR